MKQQIAAIIREYNTPTVTVEVANTDRYDRELIEIRQIIGGRLVWRAWDHEVGFENDLHRELAYYHTPV